MTCPGQKTISLYVRVQLLFTNNNPNWPINKYYFIDMFKNSILGLYIYSVYFHTNNDINQELNKLLIIILFI